MLRLNTIPIGICMLLITGSISAVGYVSYGLSRTDAAVVIARRSPNWVQLGGYSLTQPHAGAAAILRFPSFPPSLLRYRAAYGLVL
jgi:hypothetical protein